MSQALVSETAVVDVAATKKLLASIDTNNFFILISRRAAASFFEHPCCRSEEGDMVGLKKQVLPVIRDAEVRQGSILVYGMPLPQHDNPSRYAVASFWADGKWRIARDAPVHFRCLLVTGSPADMQDYTVVVRRVEIEEPERE